MVPMPSGGPRRVAIKPELKEVGRQLALPLAEPGHVAFVHRLFEHFLEPIHRAKLQPAGGCLGAPRDAYRFVLRPRFGNEEQTAQSKLD